MTLERTPLVLKHEQKAYPYRAFNLIEHREFEPTVEHELYRTPLILVDEGLAGDFARGVGGMLRKGVEGTAKFGTGLAGSAIRGTGGAIKDLGVSTLKGGGRLLGKGIEGTAKGGMGMLKWAGKGLAKGAANVARGIAGTDDPEAKKSAAYSAGRAAATKKLSPAMSGAIGGAAAGTALGGPIGTAIGGLGGAAAGKLKQWRDQRAAAAGGGGGDQQTPGQAGTGQGTAPQGGGSPGILQRMRSAFSPRQSTPEERRARQTRMRELGNEMAQAQDADFERRAAADQRLRDAGINPRTGGDLDAEQPPTSEEPEELDPRFGHFPEHPDITKRREQRKVSDAWAADKGADPAQAEKLKSAASKIKSAPRFDPNAEAKKRAPGDEAAEAARREDAAKELAAKATADQEALKQKKHQAARDASSASPRGQKKAERQKAVRIGKAKRGFQAAGGKLPGQGDPTGKPLVSPGGAQLTGDRPKIEVPKPEKKAPPGLTLPGQKPAGQPKSLVMPGDVDKEKESPGIIIPGQSPADEEPKELILPQGARKKMSLKAGSPAAKKPDVKGPPTGPTGGGGAATEGGGQQQGPGRPQKPETVRVSSGQDCPEGMVKASGPPRPGEKASCRPESLERNPLRMISAQRRSPLLLV